MTSKAMLRLQEASRGMSRTEGLAKLVVAMLFVPVPILVGGLGGFWLDYYRFKTLPLLLIVGTLLGTATSFLGVCGIIVYGHKGGTR